MFNQGKKESGDRGTQKTEQTQNNIMKQQN